MEFVCLLFNASMTYTGRTEATYLL